MSVTNNDNNSQLAWLKKGIQTLDTIGWRALKIKALCAQLNVTKGSFYHWFKSKRDYEMQVLAYWKQRFTQGFIEQAEQGKTSREKLSILGRQCIDGAINGNRLEFEINAWSFQDEAVKKFVTSVYQQRHQYLLKLLGDLYDDPIDVKKHGLILYALVVGVDFFYRPLSPEELELIFADYMI
ncbi:TetR/AcrR family transcriptional regulator [Marinicella litoralis]|uniref:TetR family transcriptional regulator n=1 Tax=Marinicella litoralis TaxID=644220 RepID=A0A4R6XR77_9GAMM|nr:TetR/AcrR family transcriptional regulator [Marinicella litoralis]TDR20494.1 TetR family transcriptional regulator [Marinicella litoralis]